MMTEYKQQIGYFAAGDVPTGKFMALYNDGSGGRVFMDVGDFYIDASEASAEYYEEQFSFDYFLEADYLMWVSIPDSYKLWCERD